MEASYCLASGMIVACHLVGEENYAFEEFDHSFGFAAVVVTFVDAERLAGREERYRELDSEEAFDLAWEPLERRSLASEEHAYQAWIDQEVEVALDLEDVDQEQQDFDHLEYLAWRYRAEDEGLHLAGQVVVGSALEQYL